MSKIYTVEQNLHGKIDTVSGEQVWGRCCKQRHLRFGKPVALETAVPSKLTTATDPLLNAAVEPDQYLAGLAYNPHAYSVVWLNTWDVVPDMAWEGQ